MRWPGNLGMTFLNGLLPRLVFPVLAVDMAILCRTRGFGLLNSSEVPYWPAVLFSVAALDWIIYMQHVLFHAVPLLWRLHRVHHTDLDYDVTTGTRFHPIEILLSMGIKIGGIALLGPPPAAVVLFEVLLNATAMFNHGNIAIPGKADRLLRWFIVTPDMHRVHHSVMPRETNSNFGFNLPWWDRLFGTYLDQPAAGHRAMQIGLPVFRDPKYLRLDRLLTQPFLHDEAKDRSAIMPSQNG